MYIKTDLTADLSKNLIELSNEWSAEIQRNITELFRWKDELKDKDPESLTETEKQILAINDTFNMQLGIDADNHIYIIVT